MTPTDRKIQIMNRTYASNVQHLTDEIIKLKMKEDPQIDLDNVTIPTEDQLIIRADLADFRVRKAEIDKAFYVSVCIFETLVIVGLCTLLALSVNGVL